MVFVRVKLGNAEGMGKTTSGTFTKMFDAVGIGTTVSFIFAPIKAIGNALFSVKEVSSR